MVEWMLTTIDSFSPKDLDSRARSLRYDDSTWEHTFLPNFASLQYMEVPLYHILCSSGSKKSHYYGKWTGWNFTRVSIS